MMVGWPEKGMDRGAKGSTTGWPSGPTALLAWPTPSSMRMQLAANLSHPLLNIDPCDLNGNLFRFPHATDATPAASTPEANYSVSTNIICRWSPHNAQHSTVVPESPPPQLGKPLIDLQSRVFWVPGGWSPTLPQPEKGGPG